MLQVPNMPPLAVAEILSEPLKRFPPSVLGALPEMDLSKVSVPALFRDHNRHLCILVRVGHKYASCIPFDSSGFRVVGLPHAQFGFAFQHVADQSVKRAIEVFLRNVPKFGATQEARRFLEDFSKENYMLHVVVVNNKVKESFNSKKDAQAFFDKLGDKEREGALIVDGPQALSAVGSVADLTTVYNSVAPKAVKKLESKGEKVLARVWEAAVAKFKEEPAVTPKTPKTPKPAAAAKPGRSVKGKSSEGEKRASTPREGSKMAKLLAVLQNGGANVATLVKASGYDEKNVRTAIGILRSGRTAGGTKYNVVLNRESGQYQVQGK